MKILLRSTILVQHSDNPDLFFKNQQALYKSRMGFEIKEDQAIWDFVSEFANTESHVPGFKTVRDHFAQQSEVQIIDRLQVISGVIPIMRGDFHRRLEDKAYERQVRRVEQLIVDASEIVRRGKEIHDGKKKVKIKGPVAALRHIVEQSHEIIAPSLGLKLSGEATTDGRDLWDEYVMVKNDPRAGLGQYTGLKEMDRLRGAKRKQLWTHAAFSGQLKCLASDVRVFDLNTRCLVSIGELFESGTLPRVHGLDQETWKIVEADVSQLRESGVRPILKVVSKTGREIRVSDNHPFLTPCGWKNASDLGPDDWVALPATLREKNNETPYSDSEIALLGYLLGDGCFTFNLSFTNTTEEILQDFIKHLRHLGYRLKDPAIARSTQATYRIEERESATQIVISRATGGEFHPWVSPLRVLLGQLGLWGKGSADKFVPGSLWGIPDKQVWLFLSALWSTDGTVNVFNRQREGRSDTKQINLVYTSKSKLLASDIQLLLQRVGVRASVFPIKVLYKEEYRIYWSVHITTQDAMRRFLEHTRIVGKENAAQEAQAALRDLEGADKFPPTVLGHLPDQLRCRTRQGGWYYARWAKKRKTICRDTVRRFGVAAQDTSLVAHANGDVWWDQIAEVVPDGTEMTYDLSVPGIENFAANGFLTHNSILALNWAYNQSVYYYYSSLYMSLEMPYDQCRRILYAMHSIHGKFRDIRMKLGIQEHPGISVGCQYERIRDGLLTDAQEEFLENHVIPDFGDKDNNPYGQIHIHTADFDKSTFTIDDLRMKSEMQFSQDPFETLFIDHAGLMTSREKYGTTTERLNEVMRDLKRYALNFNQGLGMATVALFQLSREGLKRLHKAREKGNEPLYSLYDLSYANECLVRGTKIPTKRGVFPIEEVRVGDQIWSASGWKDVLHFFDQGVRPTFEIETDRGMRLTATGSHRVRVLEKEAICWKAVGDLQENDWVLGQKAVPVFPHEAPPLPPLEFRPYEKPNGQQGIPLQAPPQMTEDLAYLMGAWDGDGKKHPKGISFTGSIKEQAVKRRLMESFQATFGHGINAQESPSRPGSFDLLKWSQPLKRWFEGLCAGRGEVVPSVILCSPCRMVLAYLQGLFDTDGCINTQNIVSLTTKNWGFANQVQEMMALLGYDSRLSERETTLKETQKTYTRCDLLLRSWETRQKFATEVGFTEPHKARRLANSVAKVPRGKTTDQVYPIPTMFLGLVADYILPSLITQGVIRESFYHTRKKVRDRGLVPSGSMRYVCEFLRKRGVDDPRLGFMEQLLDQYTVMQVTSQKPTGESAQVYDLEVGGDHEYLTGPLLSHNCERSSDVVSAGYIDKELLDQNLVQIQCLKARDDEPFETFRARVNFPYRRIVNWNEIPTTQDAEEDEDFADLLNDL